VLGVAGCAKKSTDDDATQQPTGEVRQDPGGAASCPAERAARCTEVQQKLADLEAQSAQELAAKNSKAVAETSLEINHQRELLALLLDASSTQPQFDALESKYDQLHELLAAELKHAAEQGLDPKKTAARAGALVYADREVKAVASVLKDFGDLYIAESPADSAGNPKSEEVRLDVMPWAGYWYPFRGDELFGNDDSPLSKLDRAMANAGTPTTAASVEREHRDLFYADSWEGLCGAWAVAAVTTKEPTAPLEYQGVSFSIADQKALLTKAHELYPVTMYGVRYDGNAETDGTIQDLRPEAFHQIFTKMLGERKQPFLIDDEPGIEVWSKPVFRVRWTVKKDPDHANAFYVKAMPWMTRHRSEVTDDTTTNDDIAAPVYEYRLYVDPKIKKDGRFKVIAGEWLNDSLNAHPDTLTIAAKGGEMKSGNAQVNAGMDVIQHIIQNAP